MQRPHFIARHLSARHDLMVLCPFSRIRKVLTHNSRFGIRIFRIVLVRLSPLLVYILSRQVLRAYIWMLMRFFRPDYIWLTHPELLNYLPVTISIPILYDCMDDALAFDTDSQKKMHLEKMERQLAAKAAHIFCSSRNLMYKIHQRTGCMDKCTLVYNAFEPVYSEHDVPSAAPIPKLLDYHSVGYIGTISPWMDFGALIYCLEHNQQLHIHLVGPVDKVDISLWQQHDRLHFYGPVQHHLLQAYANCFDVLIMPFRITELIRSVDPVKLYEYIYFNKAIISVRYQEIIRFSDFVSFYSDYDELSQIIWSMITVGFKPKYTSSDREAFLQINTWSNRVDKVESVLQKTACL